MGQQLRRHALCKGSQDVGDVGYELVVCEFKLSILAIMIVLF